jgi:hypothetical protein
MVLPYGYPNPQGDALKMAINEHCREDSNDMLLLWQEDLESYDSALTEGGDWRSILVVVFLWPFFGATPVQHWPGRLPTEIAWSELTMDNGDDEPLLKYRVLRHDPGHGRSGQQRLLYHRRRLHLGARRHGQSVYESLSPGCGTMDTCKRIMTKMAMVKRMAVTASMITILVAAQALSRRPASRRTKASTTPPPPLFGIGQEFRRTTFGGDAACRCGGGSANG